MNSDENPKTDMRFTTGRALVADGKFDEAIEFFSDLLTDSCSKFGDDSLMVAPVWFEYGSALLSKEEDSPSDSLLGAEAAAEAAKKLTHDYLSKTENGEIDVLSDNDDDNQGRGDLETTNQDQVYHDGDEDVEATGEATDMEIAWEALEMARTIWEKYSEIDNEKQLSEVHSRLGDLQRFNGQYEAAIEEYMKALETLECICEDSDRLLSTAHYNVAVAHIYNSSEEGKDTLIEKRKALEHYRKSHKVLTAALSTRKASNPPQPIGQSSVGSSLDGGGVGVGRDLEDMVRVMEELTETIDALEKEIADLVNNSNSYAPTTSSSGNTASTWSNGEATTTIGFGFPSSFSSDSKQTALATFGSVNPSQSSKPASSNGNGVAVLQVKKKVKTINADTDCTASFASQMGSNTHALSTKASISTERVDSTNNLGSNNALSNSKRTRDEDGAEC